MKLITAIIKPFKLDDVRKAISDVGVQGVTVTDVRGFGRQRGHTEIYRGAEYAVEFVPKIKIEIAVVDTLADQVIEAIITSAKTGKVGDGKIFVFDLAPQHHRPHKLQRLRPIPPRPLRQMPRRLPPRRLNRNSSARTRSTPVIPPGC
jgi:nitrogen regulatory protein P-II 2